MSGAFFLGQAAALSKEKDKDSRCVTLEEYKAPGLIDKPGRNLKSLSFLFGLAFRRPVCQGGTAFSGWTEQQEQRTAKT